MELNVDAGGGGVWVTCAELATRKGVSRQAVAKRVSQLERDGKIHTRREGKNRLVELAAYDRAVGEVGDAVKEQSAAAARSASKVPAALRDAQADRARYEAQLKALDLAERMGGLLPIRGKHGIEEAAKEIGLALARDADGLMRYADDIASAVSKHGVAGARRVLKEIGMRFRKTFADSLTKIANSGREAEASGPIETLLPDE